MVLSKFFAIFGSWPSLSAAELYHLNIISPTNSKLGQDFVIFEGQVDIAKLPSQSGGVVKSGQIIFDGTPTSSELVSFLLDTMKIENKIYLGFSSYPAKTSKQKKKSLFAIGIELKRRLKERGYKVRLVESRDGNLSSVVVEKNKLTSQTGVEFVYLKTDKKIYVGKTVAVQPFDKLSQRDYGRPERDDRSGMLPPKLAQIMINLNGPDKTGILLDPFCGSGTILQEALLIGWKKVVGTDKSEKAAASTQNNINWLIKKFGLDDIKVRIMAIDVRNLPDIFDQNYFSAVATEPFLGSPHLTKPQAPSVKQQLFSLYLSAYKSLGRIIKPGGRIVMVWPVIFGNYLPLQNKIVELGFRPVAPLPPEWEKTYHLNKRGNLEYGRIGQKIKREITIWQKK